MVKSMISTTDDESDSESISMGVCLGCPCFPLGIVGVAGGGDGRKAGLFGIGRKLRNGFTTLAGSAADVGSAARSILSSLLAAVFLSEMDSSRNVFVGDGGDRGPVANFLNVKY
jgi:hypothetical protein